MCVNLQGNFTIQTSTNIPSLSHLLQITTRRAETCVVNYILHKISLVPHDKIYTLVRHIANNCNHTKFK